MWAVSLASCTCWPRARCSAPMGALRPRRSSFTRRPLNQYGRCQLPPLTLLSLTATQPRRAHAIFWRSGGVRLHPERRSGFIAFMRTAKCTRYHRPHGIRVMPLFATCTNSYSCLRNNNCHHDATVYSFLSHNCLRMQRSHRGMAFLCFSAMPLRRQQETTRSNRKPR